MVFSSMTFLFVFLPLILVLYFSVKNIKLKNLILCIFSLIFYAWGEPIYIFLMMGSIIINFFITKNMSQNSKNKKAYLYLLILFNVLILFYFKYYNFIMGNISSMFNINIKIINVKLPIGISFYTFQILSYVIDVYKGKVKAEKNLVSFATYVSLFPQLIAGPIVRYETIARELNDRKCSLNSVVDGLKLFVIGLGKKVIISNSIALAVDAIYSNVSIAGTAILWFAAICYTLQIYFDFSGYSDMAIGLGKIFGFTFPKNFNYPYIAKSITDFWKRWHISLSTWFKDYVYIPLGGNRGSKIKLFRNILIVWILTGIWHGANWNYFIWGLYFAIILIIEKSFILNKLEKLPNLIKHIYSIFFIIIGWVIFRIEDLKSLLYVLKKMFIYKESNFIEYLFQNINVMQVIIYIIIGIVCSIPIINKFDKIFNNKWYYKIFKDLIIYFIFILSIIKLVGNSYNPFIYFRF